MSREKYLSRYKKLLDIKAGTRTANIGRGQDFEELINDVFEDEGILLKKSYHTSNNKAEQIDGAIEVFNRVILFEVKWVEKNIAASELYAFIGKIDSKLFGVLGLFISKNTLSDNFINAITRGRKRNVMLLHGKDIDLIFKNNIIIKDYLEHCIKLYSYDNLAHYSIEEWAKEKKFLSRAENKAQELKQGSASEVKKILNKILIDKSIPEYEIDLDVEELNISDKKKVAEYLLKEFPVYYNARIKYFFKGGSKYDNVLNTLKVIFESDEIIKDLHFKYYTFYINNPVCPYFIDFLWEKFKKYYFNLKERIKSEFNKALLKNFSSVLNDWNDENTLTKVIEHTWETMKQDVKNEFIDIFIGIYFSERRSNFAQKQFASKIVNDVNYKCKIREWIEKEIGKEVKSQNLTCKDIATEVKYFNRHYNEIRSILSLNEKDWIEYLTEIYNKSI